MRRWHRVGKKAIEVSIHKNNTNKNNINKNSINKH